MTWAKAFRAARGPLTQEGAAQLLSGPTASERCPPATIRDWEQGRRNPPKWMQRLILKEFDLHTKSQAVPRKKERAPA